MQTGYASAFIGGIMETEAISIDEYLGSDDRKKFDFIYYLCILLSFMRFPQKYHKKRVIKKKQD